MLRQMSQIEQLQSQRLRYTLATSQSDTSLRQIQSEYREAAPAAANLTSQHPKRNSRSAVLGCIREIRQLTHELEERVRRASSVETALEALPPLKMCRQTMSSSTAETPQAGRSHRRAQPAQAEPASIRWKDSGMADSFVMLLTHRGARPWDGPVLRSVVADGIATIQENHGEPDGSRCGHECNLTYEQLQTVCIFCANIACGTV